MMPCPLDPDLRPGAPTARVMDRFGRHLELVPMWMPRGSGHLTTVLKIVLDRQGLPAAMVDEGWAAQLETAR